MRCLSIRGLWSWLILRPDQTNEARVAAFQRGELKDIENRTWSTQVRGRVLIHAGKSVTRDEYYDAITTARYAGVEANFPAISDLPRGGIVGVVSIVDCVPPERRTSAWHMGGQFGFALADPMPLPFIPCRGALNFFKAPAQVEEAIGNLYNAQQSGSGR